MPQRQMMELNASNMSGHSGPMVPFQVISQPRKAAGAPSFAPGVQLQTCRGGPTVAALASSTGSSSVLRNYAKEPAHPPKLTESAVDTRGAFPRVAVKSTAPARTRRVIV
jgi:hypothetical protein